jgi:CRISPR system Cascade subunit CasE
MDQPQARRDLANRYDLHRTLCWAFAAPREAHPLWRLELTRPGEPPRLLVQSLAAPAWEEVAGRHRGYFLNHQTKPLDLRGRLVTDQRLRFRLEANPTVTRDGKRHGLWRLEDQMGWLARQAERGGFAVESAVVTRQERLALRKHDQARGIVLYSVLFDGYLRVRDAGRLVQALADGIGHGKALGLGLLSLGGG